MILFPTNPFQRGAAYVRGIATTTTRANDYFVTVNFW